MDGRRRGGGASGERTRKMRPGRAAPWPLLDGGHLFGAAVSGQATMARFCHGNGGLMPAKSKEITHAVPRRRPHRTGYWPQPGKLARKSQPESWSEKDE